MGVIFLAEHVAINKKVALKVLDRKLLEEATALPRFLREAKAASQIGHRNVVDVTDYGEVEGGGAWFAMEYLRGKNLKEVLAERKQLPWKRVRVIARQILQGLGAAHELDIVHRDMKPENCFLVDHEGGDDHVKVLDFGIAKLLHRDSSGGNSVITETGVVMGTPRYMSPEQARGEHPDHRTDLYSAGIVMYELLTGAPPFTDRNWMKVLQAHVLHPPKPLREAAPDAGIPEAAEQIVLRALTKDRTERYQTAREFIDALDLSEKAERPAAEESLAEAATSAVAEQGDRYLKGMAAGIAVTVAVIALVGAVLFFLLT
jgi:serine/threonine-protein kinase